MSRDLILAALRTHQGEASPLPSPLPADAGEPDGLVVRFTAVLGHVGGRYVERAAGHELAEIVRSVYPDATRVVSAVEELPISTVTVSTESTAAELVEVQLAIVRGRIGVAENAAVWVDDAQLPHRALPFIAEHCVLILSPEDLVTDMHAAYASLAGNAYGWGAFISGPSKTADIEQALVIGAQGPRTLLVVLDRTE